MNSSVYIIGNYKDGTWSWDRVATKSQIDELNGNIANNYTDYNSTGKYHIRVCVMGKIVVVSGVIFGTGQAEYLNEVNLPTPAYYTNGNTEYIANAVIFNARNQTTGAVQQMRVGGDFKIYLEATMTLNQPYAFGFSYCKA